MPIILKEYENWGLCQEVKKSWVWHYDDRDIERLSMIITLHDIGLPMKKLGNTCF
ncbi:MAG: MerR family transcriptional regulator [Coprobacillus cateniformis]